MGGNRSYKPYGWYGRVVSVRYDGTLTVLSNGAFVTTRAGWGIGLGLGLGMIGIGIGIRHGIGIGGLEERAPEGDLGLGT